jgi:hypothetical protein
MKVNFMKQVLIILLSSICLIVNATESEDLILENKILAEKLKRSNSHLALYQNELQTKEIKEKMGKGNSSSIIAITTQSVFVEINEMVIELKVGDNYKGEKIKSINSDGFTLSNGKKINALR